MPWMYLNIMKKSDIDMKSSIGKQIRLRKLVLAPKKSYYTYLIIDIAKYNAGKTKLSESSLLPHEASMHDFLLFRSCILYVGKGISNRKHMHLTLAKQLYLGLLPKRKINLKVSKIASLWKQGKGITLIQLDCDATSYEAFTRENCIINQLVVYHSVVLVHKVIQNKSPKYLHSRFDAEYKYKTKQADNGLLRQTRDLGL